MPEKSEKENKVNSKKKSDIQKLIRRIELLEQEVKNLKNEAKNNVDKNNQAVGSESSIFDGEHEYICLRAASSEFCVKENKFRYIGFDICIDEGDLCPFAIKVN